MGEERVVRLSRDGAVATITFLRPPVNAISPQLVVELGEVVNQLHDDRSVRCVVVTSGLDRAFMAGADIGVMAGGGDAAGFEQLSGHLRTLERLEKPTIAAINGHALGGGCELALCCDYRVMVDDGRATIGLTETTLGILPGGGGTQRLPRLVGRQRAVHLIYEGRRLLAPEALAIGLVDAAVPRDDFTAAVADRAQRLASLATRALGLAKRAMLDGLDGSLADGLRCEQQAFVEVLQTADAAEGLGAFLEKRAPSFDGR